MHALPTVTRASPLRDPWLSHTHPSPVRAADATKNGCPSLVSATHLQCPSLVSATHLQCPSLVSATHLLLSSRAPVNHLLSERSLSILRRRASNRGKVCLSSSSS